MAEYLVETTSGPVTGESKRGVQRWKGMPFAAPPVGELRFAGPQPPVPWTEPLNATGRFPICPQLVGDLEAAAGGGGGTEQSEAGCLTLNVWTPAADDRRRPVMFWIHGGGFTSGAGIIPWYDGSNLAKRDVVVVTCNYRLGPLGFLYLDPLGGDDVAGSGNAGILDQVAALEWVRDNIASFGGDPDNVTIFGESAGGMSVGTLLGTPVARGLFHKAIPQSGAASAVRTTESAIALTEKVMAAAGVDGVGALRSLPVDELVNAQAALRTNIAGDGLPFAPVVDGVVLPEAPLTAVAEGGAAGVDLLCGWNAEEMRLFSLLDPRLSSVERDTLQRIVGRRAGPDVDSEVVVSAYEAAAGRDQLFNALATDVVFRLPAVALLDAQAPHARTYGYEFRFASTAFGGALGAGHAVEIPFVFDNLDRPGVQFLTGEATDDMHSLATAMADAWVTFAREGTPTSHALPAWPRYDSDTRHTMILALEATLESDPGSKLRTLWPAGSF